MGYDETLAGRIAAILGKKNGLQAKKMFGGIGYLLNGNMVCGVIKNDLIVRIGSEKTPWALAQPYKRPFDFSGKLSRNWVVIAPPGCASEEDLADWVERGLQYASTLPSK
jgi:TfoX/Sxy family transcriptional regulator of competence genes